MMKLVCAALANNVVPSEVLPRTPNAKNRRSNNAKENPLTVKAQRGEPNPKHMSLERSPDLPRE